MAESNYLPTSSHRVTIFYRFHALHGHRFRPIKDMPGQPPTYVVQRTDGRRFSIPIWMTQPAAAEFKVVDEPWVDPSALMELATLVSAALCDLAAGRGKLMADTHAEEAHDHDSKTAEALSDGGLTATRAATPAPSKGRSPATHGGTADPSGNRAKPRKSRHGGRR